MLSYEICKQLKDAGFPKLSNKHSYFSFYEEWHDNKMDLFDDKWREPTLSELIDACGKIVLWSYKDKWYAGKNNEICCSEFYFDGYPIPLEEGDTPEEAVAYLWLEINKK